MCKRRPKREWHSRTRARVVQLAMLWVAAAWIMVPAQASAYAAFGSLAAYASGDGEIISRSAGGAGQTWVSDHGFSSGSGGATAESRYYADLRTGSLGTYVHGHSWQANTWTGGGGTVEAIVTLVDSLTCTVPAGTYPSGLSVTLHGHIAGLITAEGCDGANCSNAFQIWNFQLGSDLFFVVPEDTHTYAGDPPFSIDQAFALSEEIVAPGSVLADPLEVVVPVSASMTGRGLAQATYPSGDPVTDALSSFGGGAKFTSLALPGGVSCDSESGVFLQGAVPALSGGGALLLALALLATVALVVPKTRLK